MHDQENERKRKSDAIEQPATTARPKVLKQASLEAMFGSPIKSSSLKNSTPPSGLRSPLSPSNKVMKRVTEPEDIWTYEGPTVKILDLPPPPRKNKKDKDVKPIPHKKSQVPQLPCTEYQTSSDLLKALSSLPNPVQFNGCYSIVAHPDIQHRVRINIVIQDIKERVKWAIDKSNISTALEGGGHRRTYTCSCGNRCRGVVKVSAMKDSSHPHFEGQKVEVVIEHPT
ncbi:hypothetical protein DL96DRAFT_908574 [Flagelloscypha sp. PMI_526]|nr:hypothetical protein DL96DRAFT_908574 [Flagelloscypha sp. PMI_526]